MEDAAEMVLNNPRTREAIIGAAAQVNAKVRQGVEAFVEREIERATAPLRARIAELEERVALLEQGGGGDSRPEATAERRVRHLDRDSI